MANWPSTIPQLPKVGFAEEPEPNTIRYQTDGGPAEVRQRSTKTVTTLKTTMEFTGAQLATLMTFYNTTLSSGTLTFDWEHFRTDAAATFRFVKPPKWVNTIPAKDPLLRRYDVTIEVEEA